MKIKVNLSNIGNAVIQMEKHKQDLRKKCKIFLKRLCEAGYNVAYAEISDHTFSGETLNSLKIESVGGHRYKLSAQSQALLFFEFGTGIKHSSQTHPKAAEFGMGAGSYPGKGHWSNPNGWWYPTSDPRLIIRRDENGQGWGHTYGNPPYMPMYKASREILSRITDIAREVFSL